MLKILDIFFVVFHSCVIIFNTTGYLFRKLRKYNLLLLLVTALFWFGFGLFYGWGYCPLTDWHWKVLKQLHKTGLPSSYIEYLAERITPLDFDSRMVDKITLFVFLFSLTISTFLNLRDFTLTRKTGQNSEKNIKPGDKLIN